MRIFDLIKISFEALRSHKLRTFLTILGIVIGVTSVITIVSIVIGMNNKVTNLINQMGSSTFVVSKFGIGDMSSEEAYREAFKRKRLRYRDIEAIREGCEYCADVGGRAITFRQVKYKSVKLNSVVIAGVSSNFTRITDFEIEDGRAHNQFEEEHYRQVVILGDKIKRDLFPYSDPLGKELKIGTHKYEVIGTAKPRGSILGEDLDNFVLIPLTTHLKNYGSGSFRDLDIFVKANSEEVIEDAIDQTRVIMRARRKVDFNESDNFGITTSEEWLEFYGNVTKTIQIVIVGIPLIALVVAGIVVMNIMMVSVTERTREIGIRKSIGARKRHILLQFLVEALMMSLFGGAVGIGLGIWLAKVLAGAGDLPFIVSTAAILGGVFISTGIGVIFGMYPAVKGANLDPIDAMRFE